MKKAIFLAGMLLLCFACSKDDQEFESIYDVSSNYYFAANMDGVPLIIQADNTNYYNYSAEEGEESLFGYVAGSESYFVGSEEDAEQVSIFFLKTFENEPTDCAELSTILNVGSNNYAGVTSFENLTVSDGVAINYVDANGVLWSTGTLDGDFSDGEFKITEITKYKDDPTTCVVKARFSCTLYNEYGTSVKLTNGELCAMFPSCKEAEEGSEDPEDLEGDSGTFVDARDNQEYSWVRIGNQIWMAENLKATKYRNGDVLPNVTENAEWYNLKKGAYCNFENNANNGSKSGLLYNWYAVNDDRKIAPKGWHVATDDEWAELLNYVSNNLGQSCGTNSALAAQSDWGTNSSNECFPGKNYSTNNSSGFTALPGGYRYLDGTFDGDYDAYWWSATVHTSAHAYCRYIWAHMDEVERGSLSQKTGMFVRCVKD
ncbi:fibrobacter succinogenes major paralogous domain-containing protein [Mangrovibacterium diazotrophicum]|uniref:Uncharacterized protein (TIGR02145 family) n=1 Tax=Mangrovibacterium diazotrophicum TaxID=1261403 RepID=A0A419WBE0_9BACT|nr:fibrobacter succinogenes major paralogous domain-containing protein [Mangrovibacterium diazotrophicum]RKD92801.1 uncharacterized protein (TIGR02145 family) [Mangrovibacterium diazotrophicum]